MQIHQQLSPNFGPRKAGKTAHTVILHFTGMDSAAAALARLCDPVAEVSAHYLIGADGQIWQLVAEEMRAWHAGASFWAGERDMNSVSLGIELDYPGSRADFPPFPAAQIAALASVLEGIFRRWQIPADHVLGHSDIAPSRKPDPGPKFDWQGLARRGFAEPAAAPADHGLSFTEAMAAIGYDPDLDVAHLLAAFRLRWRQSAIGRGGAPEADDRLLANGLAARRLTAAAPAIS